MLYRSLIDVFTYFRKSLIKYMCLHMCLEIKHGHIYMYAWSLTFTPQTVIAASY